MARRFDRPTAGNMTTAVQIVRYFDKFLTALETGLTNIETTQADLAAAVADIQAMFDDDTLTPAEKPVWVFMHSFLTGEQAGLDAEATSYGITTEKTNYDNAISALTTYLGTLTTAVAWNDLSGNTTIVGTTFRSKFNDVMTTKQALINAIAAAAKTLADAAQADATTAQSTANTANTTATAAQSTANTAKRDDSISASWTSPGSILTGSDAGADATITIASHTRKYGDTTSVAVNGGTLTGRAYSTTYYIYYDDGGKSGGAVGYGSTTDPNGALPNAAAGRHYCGSITTPASGGGSTSGGTVPPGGDFSGPGEIP